MTTSPLANRTATRELLDAFGLATKHRLGQNFLVDNHVIERICELAELEGTEAVLEIGPGIGTLTLALVQEAASVTSIEMDAELEPVLAAHALRHPSFHYVMGDALRVTPDAIQQVSGTLPSVLVANLPYNVAATLILAYIERMPSLTRMVVMVQKEVADRICARPGSKAYGAYTAKLALFGEVTGRFEVPPRCFMPAPHVDSAVVRIDRVCDGGADELSLPPDAPRGEGMGAVREVRATDPRVSQVIDAAFAQRRKTIRNSMSARGIDKQALDEAFAQTGIAPTARAETIEPAQFVALTSALVAMGCALPRDNRVAARASEQAGRGERRD